jgi:pentose-5-phosphate-3-epimerase
MVSIHLMIVNSNKKIMQFEKKSASLIFKIKTRIQ